MRRVASLAVLAAVGEVVKKVPASAHTCRWRLVRGEVATLFVVRRPIRQKGGMS